MGGFLVGLAQPAHAVVPGEQRVMTWNMAHTPKAWQNAYNYALRYDIVALQEMPMSAISAANVVNDGEILVPGTSYRIERKRLTSRLGYRSDIYLTYVEDSLRPQMYRLGFMTHRRPESVEIVETQFANTRPGLVIVDGTGADAMTFGSIHAISPGGANGSEFVNAVAGRAGALSAGRWAVLGDYNREPGTMADLPANSLTHSTAHAVRTFRTGGRYDYMVASQRFSDWEIVGRADTTHDSDHYPVFFGDLQAGADPGVPYWLTGGTSENTASWTIGVDQARLEDDSIGEDAPFVLQNIRAKNTSQVLSPFGAIDVSGKKYSLLLLARSLKCLTIAPDGTGKIVHKNCQTGQKESQLWRFDSDSGQLVNPEGFTIAPENQRVGSGLRAVSQGTTPTWKWKTKLFQGCPPSSAGNVTVSSALNVSVLSDGQTPLPGPEPDPCTAVPTVVSMGDSYISGEAGRWAGNADASADGSVWGTDRSAVGCNAGESSCTHDLTRVYGDTSYAAKPDAACDRSDSAEINGVAVPGAETVDRVNLACSGATTASVLTTTFKGERPQIEQLRDLTATRDVSTVVLSIGGNDLQFSDIVKECVKAYLAPAVNNNGCRAVKQADFDAALGAVEEDVVKSVTGIRDVLRDSGQSDNSYRIVLQSYPNPLPKSSEYRYPENSSNPFEKYGRYTKGGCPFLDKDSDWARDHVMANITAMLSRAATRAKVSFLDLQDAFTGHELCSTSTHQATSANNSTAPLDAAQAEWIRWVPYLIDTDIPWTAQGHQQEAIHPNYYGQQALSACLTKILADPDTGPVTSRCTGSAGSSPGGLDDTSQVLAKGNRRTGLGGDLPDWSKAGYRGGQRLPGPAERSNDPRCEITPQVLADHYNVKADDGQDDTAGIQKAIDDIRTTCTPNASPTKLSSIELPKGTLEVSKQLAVDASYLVIRGQGTKADSGTKIVFRPGSATRYDTLYQGSRWDQDSMRYVCQGTIGSITGTGGWIWPGRGLFRVQTREVSAKHQRMCGNISAIPENRRDLFEGSVNQHWESGVTLAENTSTPGYAAREGDSTIQLNAAADMSVFKPGGYLWVGAANSMKFYQSQQIDTAGQLGSLEDLHMRQQVFTISSVDSTRRTVTIDKPLEFDVPVNSVSDGSAPISPGGPAYPSKVTPLKMITDVGFEDFTFTQQMDGLTAQCVDLTTNCATHNYGNLAPDAAMHGIVFKWAANSWVRGIRGEMTGSHPVVTEVAKNLQIENNYFDGAWNKGKGGNGYLRGSRVWDSLYAFNTTRNLRHFTFQWSSSGNVAFANDFDSDLNLHGGWERRNLFDNNTVHVPYNHSSSNCSANCGGEGGVGDKGTWWPIYWSAGNKAVKWSGSSGPQNVFFNNNLTKQTTKNGPYALYQPYSTRGRAYQFGSAEDSPRSFKHLDYGTGSLPPIDTNPIQDWAGYENGSFTSGLGVNDNYQDSGDSLFLKSFRR
ncbi:hypothetical protein ACIQM0_21920 [Streptomyces sp. NPDC091387]|uniref:hypothetical protein n=1 Tax=Streptomyces sp. NPDC091387 TaxID=3365998 RepID=UPI00381B8A11